MNNTNEIKSILKQLQLDEKTVDELDCESNLFEMGLDSIMVIKLIVLLEEKYNIEFNDTDLSFSNYSTLTGIQNILKKYIN